jgi:hypothetical protein
MNLSIKISVLAILQLLAIRTLADEPPRLDAAVADPSAPLTFIAYGDTRFTQRDGVANAVARRALVARMASENPAAIFIGGDLVGAIRSQPSCRDRLERAGSLRSQSQGQPAASQKWGDTTNSAGFTLARFG